MLILHVILPSSIMRALSCYVAYQEEFLFLNLKPQVSLNVMYDGIGALLLTVIILQRDTSLQVRPPLRCIFFVLSYFF